MKTIKITRYEALDGKRFETEHECWKYEKTLIPTDKLKFFDDEYNEIPIDKVIYSDFELNLEDVFYIYIANVETRVWATTHLNWFGYNSIYDKINNCPFIECCLVYNDCDGEFKYYEDFKEECKKIDMMFADCRL